MSHDISTALRLAEHFRQENENLRGQLSMALSSPPRPMVVSFAGWEVNRVAENIRVRPPGGAAVFHNPNHPLFGLLAAIADYQP